MIGGAADGRKQEPHERSNDDDHVEYHGGFRAAQPRRVGRSARSDDGTRGAHRRCLLTRRVRGPQRLGRMGDPVLHPRLRGAVRDELCSAAFRAARGRPALRLRAPARARSRTDDRLLRRCRPAGGVAGGCRDCAVHRRVGRGRLRNPARPGADGAVLLLGTGRAHRVRDRARLRADPGRRAHLRGRRSRHLRRFDVVRLPALAPQQGHRDRAAARRVDLPRRAQRVPAVPVRSSAATTTDGGVPRGEDTA